jgi:hypothetical protein
MVRKLKDDLANNYLLGSDQYPDTFDKALQVLGNYQAPKNMVPYRGSPSTGVAFIQRERGTGQGAGQGKGGVGHGGSGSDGNVAGAETSSLSRSSAGERVNTNSKGESHCYNCGKGDHWVQECPHLSNEQQQQLHMILEGLERNDKCQEEAHQLMHLALAQGALLPNNRAYLDGCSTVTAFKSKKYLKEVRERDDSIRINCNAGVVVTNLMGKYRSINAWYIPEGIANIFSMHELEKKHWITYNSRQGYYEVHTPSGTVKFCKDKQGLPYINLDGSGGEAAVMLLKTAMGLESKDNYINVQTVRENYEGYTTREVLKAKEAHRAQGLIGNPSEGDYTAMVRGNVICNCPIAPDDITNLRAIFRPNLASIRGKTAWRTPAPVVVDYVDIPRSIVQSSKIVTLAADVFFVDGRPFLITVSRCIKFIMAEYMQTRMAESLCKHLERVLQVYRRAGFVVRTILIDG